MAITKACYFRVLKQYNSCCISLLEKHKYLQRTTTIQKRFFWEPDRKGGYKTAEKLGKISTFEHLKNGFKELRSELKLFGEEIKALIEMDPLLIARPENSCLAAETEKELFAETNTETFTTSKPLSHTY